MKKSHNRIYLLTSVLVAFVLFVGTKMPVDAYIQKDGTVSEAVSLRQNADEDSTKVMELTAGQAVKVNNELTDNTGVKWYQVFVNGNTIGYVPASTVSVGGSQGSTASSSTNDATSNSTTATATSTQTQTQTQTVTTTERVGTVTAQSAIRVREEASTSSDQVASMEVNDTFLVLDEKDAADGHVWYKVEFDDHGTTVYGYVRSDLVSVEEVTKQEEVQVEVPVTPSNETVAEPPYSIISQKDSAGTTAWYVLDASTGEAVEVGSLLSGATANTKAGAGTKIVLILSVLLLIIAVGVATFFYMRWQDAEEFIDELHEKQQKAKRPQPQAQSQARTVPTAKTPVTSSNAGIPGMKPMPKPSQPVSRPVSQPLPRPTSQPVSRPVGQPLPKPSQPLPRPTSQPVRPLTPTSAQPVTPNTADIVNTTKKELQNQTTVKANPNTGWKSKNFLTDDYDELEFDFLDMDDKE